MTTVGISVIAIGVLLAMLALRFPIGAALGIVSIVGIVLVRGPFAAIGSMEAMGYAFVASWQLSSLPMFLLMGAVAFHSGLTANLYAVARLWLSGLPGGLAVASNFACAGFAAASGSSLATAAAMGRLAVPEMLRYRYDPGLATGTVAAAGTLGSMIPPSTAFVLYGIFTDTSIGALLVAGILPGVLTALVYATMIIVRCKLNPMLAPPVTQQVTWGERFRALGAVWPLPCLIGGVIGSMYGGLATATEAAAVGAFTAYVIAVAQGRMTWSIFKASLFEAVEMTGTIFFVGLGAIFLTRFLTFAGMPGFLTGQVTAMGLDPIVIIAGTTIVYLILGCFLDPLGLMLLTVPVLSPIWRAAGLDMIWMGVLVVKFIELGLLTPPVGMNVYVIKSVVGDAVPLSRIFRGAMWFLGAEIFVTGALVVFPEISLFLPGLLE